MSRWDGHISKLKTNYEQISLLVGGFLTYLTASTMTFRISSALPRVGV